MVHDSKLTFICRIRLLPWSQNHEHFQDKICLEKPWRVLIIISYQPWTELHHNIKVGWQGHLLAAGNVMFQTCTAPNCFNSSSYNLVRIILGLFWCFNPNIMTFGWRVSNGNAYSPWKRGSYKSTVHAPICFKSSHHECGNWSSSSSLFYLQLGTSADTWITFKCSKKPLGPISGNLPGFAWSVQC